MPDSGPNPDKHVFRVLAVDKVRYVGEGVAIVVADTRYIAEDARDLIDVEYECPRSSSRIRSPPRIIRR